MFRQWLRYYKKLPFHSRYRATLVFKRILTSFPPDMMYLGIKSMFQSLLCPSYFGGSCPSLNSFHKLVRFTDAPYPP